MTDVGTIDARWLLASSEAAPRASKRIAWQSGTIARIEDAPARTPGDLFVMPALANGHDHCRGIANVSFGVNDQSFESWLPMQYNAPAADPYLVAGVSYARLALGGVGATVHFHVPQSTPKMFDEAVACARAAHDVGIRLAFCVPMRDRNRLAYAPNEKVLAYIEPSLRDEILRRFERLVLSPREQVQLVENIAAEIEDDLVNVQFSPSGVQWCSNALIEAIAESSARTGRYVQMHLIESKRQREFADATYPEGVVRYLDSVGLLSERLTIAHGVWLRPDEIELLAERKVTVAVNTSSNLRLRNGIAPVADFIKSGMNIALGVDNMALDDDDDGFRELRLAHFVHGGFGGDEGLTWRRALRAMGPNGHRIIRCRDDVGTLATGADADLVALDYAALACDAVESDPLELTLGRATSRAVRHLVVAGRDVVKDGRLVSFDLPAAKGELKSQAMRAAGKIVDERPLLINLQTAVGKFFADNRHLS